MRQPVPTRTMGFDGWLWIMVIATVPVQQLLFNEFGTSARLLPLFASVFSLMLLRVARIPGQFALTIAAILIVLASMISGTNSSVTASMQAGIPLAMLIAIAPSAVLFQIKRYSNFLRSMITAFVLVQAVSGTLAILQMIGLQVPGIAIIAGRARGLAGHPNVLGIMSTIAILIILELWRRRQMGRTTMVILLGINGAALVGSSSLSALIMLGSGVSFFVLAIRGLSRYVLATGLVLFLAAALYISGGDLTVLLPDSLSDRVDEVTADGGDRASWLIRLGTYSFALDYIATDPLIGVGMDAMNQSTTQQGLVVHNYLLRAWFQGGITLLIAFSVVTLFLITASVRFIRRKGILAPSAIVISMIVFGMTASLYTQSHYWLILLCPVAVMASLDGSMPSETASRNPRTIPMPGDVPRKT